MDTNRMIMVSLSIIFIFLLSSSSGVYSAIVKNIPGFEGDLPFTLETGYVGLGAENEVQIFYYFVESQRDPLHDPLLFYLTGGPGSSALYPFLFLIEVKRWGCLLESTVQLGGFDGIPAEFEGVLFQWFIEFFDETVTSNGPLNVNIDNSTWEKLALELNPYTWAKRANVIFVDLPVGTGFSYATTYEASKSSDSITAIQGYKFLVKWLEEHPRFLNNPLYIGGSSYMGIIIPVVTLEIYKGNEREDLPHLNIKGCMIVSPLTDKFIDFNSRVEFAHRLALISDDIYDSAKESCRGNYIDRVSENSECSNSLQRMDECTSKINFGNILYPFCGDDIVDPTCLEAGKTYLENFGNDKEVQKALYIREGTVETFELSNQSIHYDVNKEDSECYAYDIFSTISYHQMLGSRNCQVLIMSADHDLTFPYVGVEQWIKSLNLPIKSQWNPWFVNKQVAGYRTIYAKNEYTLTHATIKGAGHSVALYKPEESWVMFNGWLAGHYDLSDS